MTVSSLSVGQLSPWCGRGYRCSSGQHETDASAGSYGRLSSRFLELFPESGNVRIDHVGAWIEVHVPHFVVQLAPRNCLARLEHQMLEQLELHRSQTQFLGIACDTSRQTVE